MAAFPILLHLFKSTPLSYGLGWSWRDLSYSGFWEPLGQFRNLVLNGWHPLIPWLAFLCLGMGLGRCGLERIGVRRLMLAGGLAAMLLGLADQETILAELEGEERLVLASFRACLFAVGALGLGWLWRLRFRRGPMEWAMRRLCG